MKRTPSGTGCGGRDPWLAPGRSDGGFALLDLMISVLLLGLFLVPLAISRNNVILTAGTTARLREARFLALQKMGELEGRDPEDMGDAGGDFGDAHPGFHWEVRIEVLPLEEVVGASPEEEETFETASETDEEEEPPVEVIRLTLTVQFQPGEDFGFVEEEVPDEERKLRRMDRIVLVRYLLREPEEETDAGGSE